MTAPLRVAFVGKGGAGKSLVAATCARLIAARGAPVLAVDLDTMPGLTLSLGAGDLREASLPDDLAEQREGQGWVMKEPVSARALVDSYARLAPDGVRVLTLGKLPGEWRPGATVALRHVLRTLDAPDWTVIGDLPAGTRQPAFGWTEFARLVAVVVEPTAMSVLSGRRIATLLATRWPDRRIGVVVSKARPGDDPAAVARAVGPELLGSVPYDDDVRSAEQAGRAPFDAAPRSRAVEAVRRLVAALEAR